MAIQYGPLEIRWLGHAGFLVTGTKRVYIDPFQIDPRDKPMADYLLVTHSHYDHLSIADDEHVVNRETTIICAADCAEKLGKLHAKQVKALKPGESYEDEHIRVEAVRAYNPEKPFHPKANDWLGFVVTLDKVTFYHSGDSDVIPEMEDVECNLAMLPVSGTYVMTAEEAVRAAAMIEAEVAIPMHWGNLVGTREDALRFKKLADCKTVILEKE